MLKAELDGKRFSHYAKEWVAKQNFAESTETDLVQRLEKNIYPFLDNKPVETFTTLDLLKTLTKVSDRGARETAIRMAGVLRKVFNELLILGLIENNPAQGLAELLPKPDHPSKQPTSHSQGWSELETHPEPVHHRRSAFRNRHRMGYAQKR